MSDQYMHLMPVAILGLCMTLAGVWFARRKPDGVIELKAGTLIHVNGLPYRLRWATDVDGVNKP